MSNAQSATVRVMSAGAPKTGVLRCADAFRERCGRRVAVQFATAPVIRERVEGGTANADVVIAPVSAMRAFEGAGLVAPATTRLVGSVTAGVVVRTGAPKPDISSVASLKACVLAAQSIVYNQASSGQYVAELFERLGIADQIAEKTTRVPTGAAVMQHLASSDIESEIGFGQITAIRLHSDRGVELVGPLPREIGKVTTYEAGLLSAANVDESARAFIEFIATSAARQILRVAGVE